MASVVAKIKQNSEDGRRVLAELRKALGSVVFDDDELGDDSREKTCSIDRPKSDKPKGSNGSIPVNKAVT